MLTILNILISFDSCISTAQEPAESRAQVSVIATFFTRIARNPKPRFA